MEDETDVIQKRRGRRIIRSTRVKPWVKSDLNDVTNKEYPGKVMDKIIICCTVGRDKRVKNAEE